jgi:hypothetical protein
MQCCATGRVVPDVSKLCTAFTIKGQAVDCLTLENGRNTIRQNVTNHSPNDNASHSRRPEPLGIINIHLCLFVQIMQIITGKKSNVGVVALLTVVAQ